MGGLARELYQQILRDVDMPVLCCAHFGLLAAKYPSVKADTICAILSQENQYKVIKSHHVHKANMGTYSTRYAAGEDVLDLCADVDFPPCLMMRRMLELLLKVSKQRVSDILKDPSLLGTLDRQSCLQEWLVAAVQQQQQLLQHQLAQPQQHRHQQHRQQQKLQEQHRHREQQQLLLQGLEAASSPQGVAALLQRLQVDVVRCVHADSSYSPYCDMAKSLAGLEHEAKLYAALNTADIPFWTEQQLRQKGLFKTPDALLQVPICVRACASECWHLVHWIDSKASFGDERTHSSQLEGQYRTYTNRYGPGLVIYWFGFLADMENDAEVLMLDDFPPPHNVMQLPRLQLPQLRGTMPTQPAAAESIDAEAAPAAAATGAADSVTAPARGPGTVAVQ